MQNTTVLRCLIAGDQALPIQCAEILTARGHQIAGVITSNPAFQHWASERGIAHTGPEGNLAGFAHQHPYDSLFSIVNGTILPDELIQAASRVAINFHDGPLPGLAGFNVTNWALLNGRKEHGITWHQMQTRLDAGPIYKQVLFEVGDQETAFTLNAKCYEAALRSFPELIEELESGRATAIPQDLTQRTYIGRFKRPAAFCSVDWEQPAESLDALCRSLDFGPYPNPFGQARIWDGEELLRFGSLELQETSTEPAGVFAALPDGALRVGTATRDVIIRGLRRANGDPWRPASQAGSFPRLDPVVSRRLTELHAATARQEPFWVAALQAAEPLNAEIDLDHSNGRPSVNEIPVAVPADADGSSIAGAYLAFWARLSGAASFAVGLQDSRVEAQLSGLPLVAASIQPLVVKASQDQTVAELLSWAEEAIALQAAKGPVPLDLPDRYPELRDAAGRFSPERCAVGIRIEDDEPVAARFTLPGLALTLIVPRSGGDCRLAYAANLLAEPQAKLWAERIAHAIQTALANRDAKIGDLPSVSPREWDLIIQRWNDTGKDYDATCCVHELFERQALERPNSVAVVFEGRQLTYSQLNRRANQVAHYLRSLRVAPNQLVGLYCERSIETVVGMLGVLKAGAAYLPIDAAFPAQRRAMMIEDSETRVVVTQQRLAGGVEQPGIQRVILDAAESPLNQMPETNPPRSAQSGDLAYVIFTSGSTGRPKGVEITHRNAVNFFIAMDEYAGKDPGVWLAVTSISFDISVFELLWTLARGFKVVVAAEEHRAQVLRQSRAAADHKQLDFSLFYFSSDEGEARAGDKYRLLLEGARFADANDFRAVWTPERHFHAFGGLYPNPAVTSSAIAAITKKVHIRAGSVVSPLHHPVRIAEEWSVVDNISNGRVGISFASGWHARDFLLAPDNYKRAKAVMFESVDAVRKLWKGESLTFPDGLGNPAEVSIRPRPVQPDLPVWITAAGSPETFRMAGERGYSILTHLLGQKIEEVAKKIEIYRAARASAGFDPDGGSVTLMLHTYVAESREKAREAVREPMKQYLRSSADLIKKSPWSFPAFANKPQVTDGASLDLSTLTDEEMEILLEHSFERYFETSGLFGTVEECAAIADRAREIGVTEIACLIDFGVGADLTLEALPLLNAVRQRVAAPPDQRADYSLPAQIAMHGVTHMQCTPSLAKMMVATEDSREAITRLDRFFVGGEALPGALASQIAELAGGRAFNMYGPTETTVWSTVAAVDEDVTIGRPIANTSIYILDSQMRPVPIGVTGELYIGGDGVARGYWRNLELTANKFLPNELQSGGRMYRTGDLARYRVDGSIEFLGRTDHQVKIRGYRVELGEIESALLSHPDVRDAVVQAIAREPAPVLAGYYVRGESPLDEGKLRAWLAQRLPDYMVPAHFIALDRLPTTPNGKINRAALPSPSAANGGAPTASLQSASKLEQDIAAIWSQELNRPHVGLDDNFFDIGGHSILVVQVNTKLRALLNREIALVDMFRFPTVRSLAVQLGGNDSPTKEGSESVSRANLRRNLLAGRGASRRGSEQAPTTVQ